MEIQTIIEDTLYGIQWDLEQEEDILEQMSELYNDAEYLFNYFNENIDKLSYFKGIKPLDASIRTQKEADIIIQLLKDIALSGMEQKDMSLDDIFEPLHSIAAYNHNRYHTDVKAKGHPKRAPWVRLYAIKCDDNVYVLTGFAIKLVKDMRDDEELIEELNKLKRATDYLNTIQMISQ